MKWVELIRVRSSPGQLDVVLPALRAQLDALPCESQLLRHGQYDGDVAALLVWQNGTPHPSREGLLLAQHMQPHGSIDHAVWVPIDPEDEDVHRVSLKYDH
ncbi:MAG: hypothetical protein AAFV53_39515 [Myxococcota bacterium]